MSVSYSDQEVQTDEDKGCKLAAGGETGAVLVRAPCEGLAGGEFFR